MRYTDFLVHCMYLVPWQHCNQSTHSPPSTSISAAIAEQPSWLGGSCYIGQTSKQLEKPLHRQQPGSNPRPPQTKSRAMPLRWALNLLPLVVGLWRQPIELYGQYWQETRNGRLYTSITHIILTYGVGFLTCHDACQKTWFCCLDSLKATSADIKTILWTKFIEDSFSECIPVPLALRQHPQTRGSSPIFTNFSN